MILGYMPMPADFKYRDVFLKGMPHHNPCDGFLKKHPPMPASRWAKIFSPFDALKGFHDAIVSKEVQYTDRMEPDEDGQREIGRRLSILHSMTWSSRMARANQVMVTITFFVPCGDEENYAFLNRQGQYQTATGVVKNVDPDIGKAITLQADKRRMVISFSDILGIESKAPGLFDLDWDQEAP